MDSIATFVTQRFNTTVAKKTVVNAECYGDDLAAWLAAQLQAGGRRSATPVSEDFGWAVKFRVNGRYYWASIGYVPGREMWFVALECGGTLARFFARFRRIPAAAVAAVRSVLEACPDLRELRWYSPRGFSEALSKPRRP